MLLTLNEVMYIKYLEWYLVHSKHRLSISYNTANVVREQAMYIGTTSKESSLAIYFIIMNAYIL